MTDQKPASVDTFKVDNQFMHNAPRLVGIEPGRPSKDGATLQLYLPNMAPLHPIDEWAVWAIYYFVHQQRDPTQTVQVSVAEFADKLREGRKRIAQTDKLGHSSDTYQLIYDALQRLYSVEVLIEFPVHGKRIQYQTRILSGFGFVYADEVSAEEVTPDRRRNINTEDRPVWKRTDKPPVGVLFTLTTELSRGLTGNGDRHIGATILPEQVFDLRKSIGKSSIAQRLLAWVTRQASRDSKIALTKLRQQLNIPGRNVSRDRDSLRKAFALLQQERVIDRWDIDRGDIVSCRKSDVYYFGKD